MSVDEAKMEPLPTATEATVAASGSEEQSPPLPPQPAAPLQESATVVPVQPPPPIGGRIRPKICDVRDCDSNSLRNPELLFVCVPGHSYPERRFVWLTLMQAARDKKRSYCCSRHFKVPEDFKDFREFISAPPGYKRQLLVKKGVVPHLNMPPLNMSALPPLTDRWPMTLPAGMTESEQLRYNAATAAARHNTVPPPRMYHGTQPLQQTTMGPPHSTTHHTAAFGLNKVHRIRYCKAVQTEPTSASVGPRKVAPSLQYCRLCFQKQDLEPIFTGDQTLIEPDLIDKIFGCTEVMISVESDFPSSICTDCYNKVHEYVKFRKLVQLNDQSLRGIPLPTLSSTPTRNAPSSVPRQNSFVRVKTTEIVPNRPTLKVTPIRPANSTPPSSIQRSPTTQQRDDPLLEVQRVENVERYQRRQETIERNQPLRAQRVQDTLYPVPYRRPVTETATTDDPLASADCDQKLSDSDNPAPEGVQLNDRIVPVTLIRVQPDTLEAEGAGHQSFNKEKSNPSGTDQPQDVTIKEEEPESEEASVQNPTTTAAHYSPKNVIRPRPLSQLMQSSEKKKANPPNVLQAVKLLPSATAKALANQKSSLKPINTLTRGITSGRFRIFNNYDKINPKAAAARILPKSMHRAVRFPGVLSNLIHRAKKPQSAQSFSKNPNPVDSPRSSLSASSNEESASSSKVQQTFEVNLSLSCPVSKSKDSTDAQPKQKEDNIPIIRPVPDITPITSKNLTPKPTNASPVPSTKTSKPVSQQKPKDNSDVNIPPELNRLSVVVSKISSKPSTPSPTAKPKSSKPGPKPEDNIITETSPTVPAPPESNVPPSPRSSRVRKVPLKFQDSVGFPMPKVISIKSEPDVPKVDSPKVSQEKPQEPTIRVTRRSNVADDKLADTSTDKKKLQAKEPATKGKPKEDEPPKNEVTRVTRRTDVAITKPEDPPQRSKPIKRKSDTKPETKEQAPPPSKSPKVVVDAPKTKHQPQQKTKQDQRANGSRKSAPAATAVAPVEAKDPLPSTKSVKPKKRQELERAKTPVSSKDWKCPFCTDKVFEEKKRLVKHLRKRHGMDYALVRQQLAIYGGNWR